MKNNQLRHITTISTIVFIMLASFSGIAQTKSGYLPGDWVGHLSFRNIRMTEYDGENVYAFTTHGFFKFNINEGEFYSISKIEGLSDVSISAVKYNQKNKVLLIGYNSGVVDLVYKNKLLSINDISIASGINSKRINNIHTEGDTAYLACDFGIVLLNIPKLEIQSTYFLGNSQQSILVSDIAIAFDSIWVTTDKGVYTAAQQGVNLHNFQNWKRLTNIPHDSLSFSFIQKIGDQLFMVAKNVNESTDKILKYKNGYQGNYMDDKVFKVKQLEKRGSHFSLIANYDIRILSNTGETVSTFWFNGYNQSWTPAYDAVYVNGNVFLADISYGLIKKDAAEYKILIPNSPFSNTVNQIKSYNGNVYATGGVSSAQWSRLGLFKYMDDQWYNFNDRTIAGLQSILNINYLTVDKGDKDHFFATSYGYGVLEFNDTMLINHFNQDNSPLENLEGATSGYILTSGIEYDNSGDIWVTTNLASHTLYHYKPGGEWQSFNLEGNITKSTTRSLINTPWGHMWFVDNGYGLVAFDPNKLKSGDLANGYKRFKVYGNDNNVLSSNITTLAVDKTNYIWLGLDGGGLAVYYNPQSILQRNIGAGRIIVESDGFAQYLLDNELVSTIAIDAGNRKWVGTKTGGVFLLSEDGTKQILNLNKDNSKLLSNYVRDIDIDHKTGWVYMATDKGIVAYFSGIIDRENLQEKLKVYPNPVAKNYHGLVRIEGLLDDMNIKITDATGNLIFETTATGGVGIWNMKDFDGKRVSTGVYLIYASSKDGSQTAVSKIFIASYE